MLPQIILSLVMGAIVYAVTFLKLSSVITLVIQIPVGVVVYWVGSKLFHIESYEYIVGMLKNFRKKKA